MLGLLGDKGGPFPPAHVHPVGSLNQCPHLQQQAQHGLLQQHSVGPTIGAISISGGCGAPNCNYTNGGHHHQHQHQQLEPGKLLEELPHQRERRKKLLDVFDFRDKLDLPDEEPIIIRKLEEQDIEFHGEGARVWIISRALLEPHFDRATCKWRKGFFLMSFRVMLGSGDVQQVDVPYSDIPDDPTGSHGRFFVDRLITSLQSKLRLRDELLCFPTHSKNHFQLVVLPDVCAECLTPIGDRDDDVVVCESCFDFVDLVCAGLTDLPDADKPWRCRACLELNPYDLEGINADANADVADWDLNLGADGSTTEAAALGGAVEFGLGIGAASGLPVLMADAAGAGTADGEGARAGTRPADALPSAAASSPHVGPGAEEGGMIGPSVRRQRDDGHGNGDGLPADDVRAAGAASDLAPSPADAEVLITPALIGAGGAAAAEAAVERLLGLISADGGGNAGGGHGVFDGRGCAEATGQQLTAAGRATATAAQLALAPAAGTCMNGSATADLLTAAQTVGPAAAGQEPAVGSGGVPGCIVPPYDTAPGPPLRTVSSAELERSGGSTMIIIDQLQPSLSSHGLPAGMSVTAVLPPPLPPSLASQQRRPRVAAQPQQPQERDALEDGGGLGRRARVAGMGKARDAAFQSATDSDYETESESENGLSVDSDRVSPSRVRGRGRRGGGSRARGRQAGRGRSRKAAEAAPSIHVPAGNVHLGVAPAVPHVAPVSDGGDSSSESQDTVPAALGMWAGGRRGRGGGRVRGWGRRRGGPRSGSAVASARVAAPSSPDVAAAPLEPPVDTAADVGEVSDVQLGPPPQGAPAGAELVVNEKTAAPNELGDMASPRFPGDGLPTGVDLGSQGQSGLGAVPSPRGAGGPGHSEPADGQQHPQQQQQPQQQPLQLQCAAREEDCAGSTGQQDSAPGSGTGREHSAAEAAPRGVRLKIKLHAGGALVAGAPPPTHVAAATADAALRTVADTIGAPVARSMAAAAAAAPRSEAADAAKARQRRAPGSGTVPRAAAQAGVVEPPAPVNLERAATKAATAAARAGQQSGLPPAVSSAAGSSPAFSSAVIAVRGSGVGGELQHAPALQAAAVAATGGGVEGRKAPSSREPAPPLTLEEVDARISENAAETHAGAAVQDEPTAAVAAVANAGTDASVGGGPVVPKGRGQDGDSRGATGASPATAEGDTRSEAGLQAAATANDDTDPSAPTAAGQRGYAGGVVPPPPPPLLPPPQQQQLEDAAAAAAEIPSSNTGAVAASEPTAAAGAQPTPRASCPSGRASNAVVGCPGYAAAASAAPAAANTTHASAGDAARKARSRRDPRYASVSPDADREDVPPPGARPFEPTSGATRLRPSAVTPASAAATTATASSSGAPALAGSHNAGPPGAAVGPSSTTRGAGPPPHHFQATNPAADKAPFRGPVGQSLAQAKLPAQVRRSMADMPRFPPPLPPEIAALMRNAEPPAPNITAVLLSPPAAAAAPSAAATTAVIAGSARRDKPPPPAHRRSAVEGGSSASTSVAAAQQGTGTSPAAVAARHEPSPPHLRPVQPLPGSLVARQKGREPSSSAATATAAGSRKPDVGSGPPAGREALGPRGNDNSGCTQREAPPSKPFAASAVARTPAAEGPSQARARATNGGEPPLPPPHNTPAAQEQQARGRQRARESPPPPPPPRPLDTARLGHSQDVDTAPDAAATGRPVSGGCTDARATQAASRAAQTRTGRSGPVTAGPAGAKVSSAAPPPPASEPPPHAIAGPAAPPPHPGPAAGTRPSADAAAAPVSKRRRLQQTEPDNSGQSPDGMPGPTVIMPPAAVHRHHRHTDAGVGPSIDTVATGVDRSGPPPCISAGPGGGGGNQAQARHPVPSPDPNITAADAMTDSDEDSDDDTPLIMVLASTAAAGRREAQAAPLLAVAAGEGQGGRGEGGGEEVAKEVEVVPKPGCKLGRRPGHGGRGAQAAAAAAPGRPPRAARAAAIAAMAATKTISLLKEPPALAAVDVAEEAAEDGELMQMSQSQGAKRRRARSLEKAAPVTPAGRRSGPHCRAAEVEAEAVAGRQKGDGATSVPVTSFAAASGAAKSRHGEKMTTVATALADDSAGRREYDIDDPSGEEEEEGREGEKERVDEGEVEGSGAGARPSKNRRVGDAAIPQRGPQPPSELEPRSVAGRAARSGAAWQLRRGPPEEELQREREREREDQQRHAEGRQEQELELQQEPQQEPCRKRSKHEEDERLRPQQEQPQSTQVGASAQPSHQQQQQRGPASEAEATAPAEDNKTTRIRRAAAASSRRAMLAAPVATAGPPAAATPAADATAAADAAVIAAGGEPAAGHFEGRGLTAGPPARPAAPGTASCGEAEAVMRAGLAAATVAAAAEGELALAARLAATEAELHRLQQEAEAQRRSGLRRVEELEGRLAALETSGAASPPSLKADDFKAFFKATAELLQGLTRHLAEGPTAHVRKFFLAREEEEGAGGGEAVDACGGGAGGSATWGDAGGSAGGGLPGVQPRRDLAPFGSGGQE